MRTSNLAALAAAIVAGAVSATQEVLIFSDDFNNGFNMSVWKHEIT
jgi:hypothetical protein